MPVPRPQPSEGRVIAHVDLDCFYVQVEQRKRPDLQGKPTGVVQYNPWKGGGLIAVGYEARHYGVTRNMQGDDAKKLCPEIELIQVPVAHGKADLTQYREAGSEVVSILSRKGTCERASIDEVYLDITEEASMLQLEEPFSEEVLKSYILGYSEGSEEHRDIVKKWLLRDNADIKDHLLARGAILIAELRMAVLAETGFTCSAGVAHNKMIAKLASGMHKPAQQTIVPSTAVPKLLATLPIKKMKQLGGKLGDSLKSDLQVSFVGDLLRFSKSRLQDLYGLNSGTWLWNVARGMSGDEVKARTLPKSHSCGKTFPGPKALKSVEDVQQWIQELAAELQERLDLDYHQNHRIAHLLSLHAGINQVIKVNSDRKFHSRSCVLRYGKEKLAEDAFKLFERALNAYMLPSTTFTQEIGSNMSGAWAITALFIGASNISAAPSGMNPITRFFSPAVSPLSYSLQTDSSSPSSSNLFSLVQRCGIPAPDYETRGKGIDTCQGEQSDGQNRIMKEKMSTDDRVETIRDQTSAAYKFLNARHYELQLPPSPTNISVKDKMDPTNKIQFPIIVQRSSREVSHIVECELVVEENKNEADSGVDNLSGNATQRDSQSIRRLSYEMDTSNKKKNCNVSPIHHSMGGICSSGIQNEIYDAQQINTHHFPGAENVVERENSSFPRAKRSHLRQQKEMMGFSRLKDLWTTQEPISSSISSDPFHEMLWSYRKGEIDATVLSELPEEIQQELCIGLGLKRPHLAKKSTITDFFRGQLSHGHNKS